MSYLLKTLLFLQLIGLIIVVSTAHHWINISEFGHIHLSIPYYLFVIFTQAFVMFFFIGVSRLTEKVYHALTQQVELDQLFDVTPQDLSPYIDAAKKYVQNSTIAKRQTIPWTMLILVLGMLGFLLGGAHDTGLVEKTTHSGVIYGFSASVVIGFVRQWFYLGKTHKLLRDMKSLFSLADHQM